jgi:glycosyltransferase involved in cell wall biosynthesis
MLPFSRLSNQPILFDAFVSTFDTLCADRKVFSPKSPLGKIALWLDQYSCNRATRVMVDTFAQSLFFSSTIGIPQEKIDVLPVGADDRIFFPNNEIKASDNEVLFYGSLLPLHGVNTILNAAKILEKENIRFKLIGPFKKDNLLSEPLPLNIELLPPVPLNMLPQHIAEATVCLGGHFGDSEKARRTIAGKTYQCIAMGKPTIVGANPANAELLKHTKDAWFCKMNDAQSLADAISTLMNSKQTRDEIGENAYLTFKEKASNEVLSNKLEKIIENTIHHS